MKKILVSLFLLGGLAAAYAGSDCCPSSAAKTADAKAVEAEAKVMAVSDSAKQCPMTAAKAQTAEMKTPHCSMSGAQTAEMKAHCSAEGVKTAKADAKMAGSCGDKAACGSAVKTADAKATCPMSGAKVETADMKAAADKCAKECGDACPTKVAGTTEESKDSETAAG